MRKSALKAACAGAQEHLAAALAAAMSGTPGAGGGGGGRMRAEAGPRRVNIDYNLQINF